MKCFIALYFLYINQATWILPNTVVFIRWVSGKVFGAIVSRSEIRILAPIVVVMLPVAVAYEAVGCLGSI